MTSTPTIKCQNCGKDIESFKMILHERFCSLNVRKCSICEEPIQIDEYEEHKKIKHSDKVCIKCGTKYPEKTFSEHFKSCSKKSKELKECQYCGLPLEPNELNEHENQCGSKSKQCEYCGMNVPIMEYDLHLEYACTVKQQFEGGGGEGEGGNINNINDANNTVKKTNNNNNANNYKDYNDHINYNDYIDYGDYNDYANY